MMKPFSSRRKCTHSKETRSTGTNWSMSSRRTRSGASLGNSEPRRLRRTPIRKQLEAKSAEESSTGISSQDDLFQTNLEQNSGEPVSDHTAKSRQHSPKKTQHSCSNIWERLAKNDGVLLGSSVGKEITNVTHDTANGNSRAMLKEKTILSDSSSIKKCRKPEILVSLLEGEPPFSLNHRKDIAGFGSGSIHAKEQDVDSLNKSQEKSAILTDAASNCGSEENLETYASPSSVCYFHNFENHRSDSLNDFSDMSDVPGEPFFVSLSKDENKELNMVKTSSGTVRVGCSLRKLSDHNLPYTEQCSKSSLFPPAERSKKMGYKVSSEHKSEKHSRHCLKSLDIRSHRERPDENKDHRWNYQCKNGPDSELKPIEHKNNIGKQLEIHGENSKSVCCKATWNNDICLVEKTELDNFHAPEIEPNKMMSEVTLQSESGFKMSNVISSHFKHITQCRPSQYPLMKKILVEQNYLPLTSAEPSLKNVASSTENANEASDAQYLTSAETLKPLSVSMVSLPSLLTADLDSKSKNVVKRSERIRCKSGLVKPCSVTLHQSVISTMKPADKTFKKKSRTSNSKKISKVNFGWENQHKKDKKVCESIKRTMIVKGQNDFYKNKSSMSQEVMESIIQSIEETVSGCYGEEECDSALDLASNESSVNLCTRVYTPHKDIIPRTASTPRDLINVDPWSESTLDHGCNISSSSTEFSLTPVSRSASKNSVVNSGSKKILFNSKKTACKTKKRENPGNKSKTHKMRSAKCKLKSPMITATVEDRPSSVASIYSSSEKATDHETEPPGAGITAIAGAASKRFRKRTRKAKEAFGDDDVFCDESWLVKKSKSRNRSGSNSSDSSSSSAQQRPRRSSQSDGRIIDPVLEEHAFILWASENRSQLELQHPGTPSNEVDTILLSRWCEVTENVKAKFFLRAREAFSDDDRTLLRPSSVTDLESSMFGDSDPIFTEFIRLPINRQRDMLRKWLKFFQQTLAKKEYIDFIVTFKRACNRDTSSLSRKSKRTRMRCLDPSHYKMLFDMIRLTKPRVLEMYKSRRDQDKSTGSDAYSILLLKLVKNEPIPLAELGCRSQLLTEVLQDLGILDNMEVSSSIDVDTSLISFSSSDSSIMYNSNDDKNPAEVTVPVVEWRTNLDAGSKVTVEMKTDSCWNDMSFDESDYSLLDSDLAIGLLSDLNELNELPLLDQDMLDQVFLAPPRTSAAFNQQRRAVNLYSRCIETLPQNVIPVGSRPSACSPFCLPHLLPTDSMSYPKINIHYSTAMPTSSSIMHHLQLKHMSSLPHKHPRRDTRTVSPVHGGWCRRNTSIDMHANNTSLDNMLQSPAHFSGPHNKCFKVHTKVMSPQIKLNLQPLQLPNNCRSHQQNKIHPHVIPVSCGLQQKFPTIIYSPTSPALLDKLGSHHISQMGAQSLVSSSSTSSRISPQPIGLSTQSPLITSLSPLRSVKYNHNSKSYNPHCQMVPYRPRMQLTAGSSTEYRRNTHSIPVSTSHKTNNTRAHANLQQIKVCLSTQTLKIPIAKLRESRKASHIKGKMKNFNMQPSLECYSNLPCTQACQFSVRASPSTNVLAKVLNLQAVNEMEHFTKVSVTDAVSSNTISSSRPVSSTFIGTMRPVTMQPVSSGLRSATQLHLVSVVNSPSTSSDLKTTGPTQGTMVVSPLTMNRSSHMTQVSCASITPQSKSDLSSYSFTAVTVAGAHAVTSQNVHVISRNSFVQTKNTNQCETQVCTGRNVISGSSYRDSYFQDFTEETETCGEFRIVGTCSVSTADSFKKYSSDDINPIDTIIQTAEPSISSLPCSDNTAGSVKSIDIHINKINSQDLKGFDNTKFVCIPKGIQPLSNGGKQDSLQTFAASSISCNSHHELEHVINHGADIISQQLLTPKTSPISFCVDSDQGVALSVCTNEAQISHKEDSQQSYVSRESSDPTNICQTSLQSCPSQKIITDTSFVTTDIAWEGMDDTCADKSSDVKDHCTSLVHIDCENNDSEDKSEHASTSHSSVNKCDFDEACDNKMKNSSSTNSCMPSTGDLKCDGYLLPDVIAPCISAESITTTNCSIEHNIIAATLNTDVQSINLEGNNDINKPALERNINVTNFPKLTGSQEFCEQDYSNEKFDSPCNMIKCLGAVPASHPPTCTLETSSLHVLADTASTARSLLSSKRFITPVNQTLQACDDSRMTRKQGCSESADHKLRPIMKKMTMHAVTLQSDTGCILVEKSSNQSQRADIDLPVSSGNSCRASSPPVSATNNGKQLVHDHTTFTSTTAEL